MITLSWIIIVIIGLLLAFILWKITKKIFLAIFLFFLISFIIIATIGYAVYVDVNNIVENIDQGEPVLMAFTYEDQLITAINLIGQEDNPLISDEKTKTLEEKLFNQDYELLLQNYSQLIILDFKEEEFPENITFENVTLKKEEYLPILTSEEPYLELMEILNLKPEYEEQLNDLKNEEEFPEEDLIKFMILGAAIENTDFNILESQEDFIPFMLESYQEGKIKIEKETITFKLIKLIPAPVIENILSDIQI